jgi:MOSC domain-containing protein YiiM
MTGTLLQVNRSKGGLPKRAVAGIVTLDSAGIEGDWQRDRRHHGGPNQAVLMIAVEVLEDLAARGFPVIAGSLGENLTLRGLDPTLWRMGQRYRIGETAVIELTRLRQPCANLNRYGAPIRQEIYDELCQAGDFTSPRWARGGFYARVVETGLIAAGVPVILESDIA